MYCVTKNILYIFYFLFCILYFVPDLFFLYFSNGLTNNYGNNGSKHNFN